MKATEFIPGVKFKLLSPQRKAPITYEFVKPLTYIDAIKVIEDPEGSGSTNETLINIEDRGIRCYDYCGGIRLASKLILFTELKAIT